MGKIVYSVQMENLEHQEKMEKVEDLAILVLRDFQVGQDQEDSKVKQEMLVLLEQKVFLAPMAEMAWKEKKVSKDNKDPFLGWN